MKVFISALNALSYEDRLNKVRFPSLNNIRREFMDIMFLHKLFSGEMNNIQYTALLIYT